MKKMADIIDTEIAKREKGFNNYFRIETKDSFCIRICLCVHFLQLKVPNPNCWS